MLVLVLRRALLQLGCAPFGLKDGKAPVKRPACHVFHDDIDGSSLAHAIYASTGPLLLPSDSGFRAHSKPLGHDFSDQKFVRNLVCCFHGVVL